MATRPSTLPTANPLLAAAVKHETTRVCHFKGEEMVYDATHISMNRPNESDK